MRSHPFGKTVWVLVAVVLSLTGQMTLAKDQIRDRKQLKDGSCQDDDDAIVSPGQMILAKDQERKRDRLKDGSCRS